MIREAIILAGGFGTRLRGIVNDLPKPMAPVRGKPFIEWLLNFLEKQGVAEAVLAVGYKHDIISSHFGNKYKNIRIEYSIENEPLNTGGAVLKATKKISGENFFLLNGDTYYDINLNDFTDFYISTGAVVSVSLKPVKDTGRYGSVILENNRIVAFSEKTDNNEGLINGGIYIINREWFIKNAPGKKFSMEKDILEKKVADNLITGYVSGAYFIDIGIPDDYLRAANELPLID